MFDAAPFGVLITDTSKPDDLIVHANPAFCAATGYAIEEVVGRNARFLQGTDTDPAHVASIRQALAERRPISQRILNYRKDGSPLWHDLAISPVLSASGKLRGFISIQHDVTEAVAAEAQALETLRLLENLTDDLPGFVSRRRQSSSEGQEFVFYSRSLNRLLEVERGPSNLEEFLGYLHPDDRDGLRLAVSTAADQSSEMTFDYRLLTAKGREVWIRGSSRPRRLTNGDVVWDACCIDVTSERAAQERLAYLRNRDPLTGLPTRARLEELLVDTLHTTRAGDYLTLLILEFDEVDEVRTVLGVATAERLLQGIAERLVRCAGEADRVGRVGEAQFALLAGASTGEDLAANLQGRFDAPFDLGDLALTVRPQLGLAHHPSPDAPRQISRAALASELLKNAQMALFEARRGRADEAVVYDPALKVQAARRVLLRQGLSGALDFDQFELQYQPQVDLRTLEIVGAEALIRWRHPDAGLQFPDVFIPIAEETGAIIQLGDWVLGNAIEQGRRWSQMGAGIPVSVNVSSLQIRQPGFSAGVRDLLASVGLDPRLFEIELTETFLIESSTTVEENLDELRRIGVSVAIDDLGSGYSSLQYLTRFPAQRVKIDRSLVRAIGARSHGEAVIRGVLELTRTMGVDAVFEGIENKAQLDFLRAHGARLGQGYYFSPPAPVEALEAALLRSRWARQA